MRNCDSQAIEKAQEITPEIVRGFILWHEETGHNQGGLHVAYRTLYDLEIEPENWKNPINKVKALKVPFEVLEPVEIDNVSRVHL